MVLLDGAMGTELQRRGARVELPLWSAWALIERPDLVFQIHREYLDAGAEVLTANTFRTQTRTLEKVGKGRSLARSLTRRAIELALEARADGGAEKRVLVAGSVAPLEDCYRPDLSPGAADDEFLELMDWMLEAGADVLLIETMNHIPEMRSAIRAAQRLDAPFWVSVNPSNEDPMRLLSGEGIAEAEHIAYNEGAEAFMVNCAAIPVIERAIELLIERAKLPLGCYANNGVPDPDTAWRFDREVPPSAFAEHAQRMREQGVAYLGGCCGTTPEHIAAMAEAIKEAAQ
ncbi:MAG: homocysteine S-methyltransferase family protein [Armatimonadetes bacterium]|nr:MAG: homocysteine S-methyltransferase family protein [Armatimonadota bacterium]